MSIELNQLTHRYKSVLALDKCDVVVPEGSIVALIGPNGAGKSTLLEILSGIIKPTSGTVTIFEGFEPKSSEGRRFISYMSQDAVVYPHLTVESVVRIAARLNLNFDINGVASRLETLGIRAKTKVRSLSGGQQAQLALTLALAKNPKLLLLDEPMSDLDPLARRDFLSTVLGSAVDNEQTVVFSSHDVADLSRSVDFIILLAGGRIQYVGALDDFLSEHRLVRSDPKELDSLVDIECIDRNLDTKIGEHLVRLLRPNVTFGLQSRRPTLEEAVIGYLRRAQSIGACKRIVS
jgi:ABC-2 type transport system ATP-binding protein